MIEKVELYRLKCDVCNWRHDGLFDTRTRAIRAGQLAGCEVIFGLVQCPDCNANGLLPADTPDLRVTTVPEPAAVVVVTDDDTEGA